MSEVTEADIAAAHDDKQLDELTKKCEDLKLREAIEKKREELKKQKTGDKEEVKTAPQASTAAATPTSPTSAGGGPKMTRNPSAIKQMLLEWCKKQTEGYPNVNITNFSGSWSDGMAFCALIHHFCPQAFDFSKLNPKNRRGNFTLAFDVAEKCADIAPLLDVKDMVMMKNPDWKCVFTYVQSFYRRFAMQKPSSSTSSSTADAPQSPPA